MKVVEAQQLFPLVVDLAVDPQRRAADGPERHIEAEAAELEHLLALGAQLLV